MRVSYLVQASRGPAVETIKHELESRLEARQHDIAHVAMAYVSVAGVRMLLDAFRARPLGESEWLVGLDDAVSQPGALDLLMTLPGAQVRVARTNDPASRFHPKVCRFRQASGLGRDLLMIGSANLTSGGLTANAETVVFVESQDGADKDVFAHVWANLWSLGHAPTAGELASYRQQYESAKRSRERARRSSRRRVRLAGGAHGPILTNDGAELDPSRADVCWIECGAVTAQGRELEFKAEQGLYFGLEPTGEDAKTFRFRTSAGSIVSLRMKYQENHMWRLQMNNEVPEVMAGLRPIGPDGRLGRSNMVAVFTRTDESDLFDLRFVDLGSRAFARLRRQSSRLGTLGRTTARYYGWC
jgi:hypothetical protein